MRRREPARWRGSLAVHTPVRTPVRTRGRTHRSAHVRTHVRAHSGAHSVRTGRRPQRRPTSSLAIEPRCSPLSISRLPSAATAHVRPGSALCPAHLPRRPSAFTTRPSLPPCLRAPPPSLLALPLSLLLAVVLVVLVLVCLPPSSCPRTPALSVPRCPLCICLLSFLNPVLTVPNHSPKFS